MGEPESSGVGVMVGEIKGIFLMEPVWPGPSCGESGPRSDGWMDVAEPWQGRSRAVAGLWQGCRRTVEGLWQGCSRAVAGLCLGLGLEALLLAYGLP